MAAPIDISNDSTTLTKRPVSWLNIAIGAGITVFEASTLGQPLEVIKTHLAANRSDSLLTALRKTYQRGGLMGYYQGLIPWAWIEASTKGSTWLALNNKNPYLLYYHVPRRGLVTDEL